MCRILARLVEADDKGKVDILAGFGGSI